MFITDEHCKRNRAFLRYTYLTDSVAIELVCLNIHTVLNNPSPATVLMTLMFNEDLIYLSLKAISYFKKAVVIDPKQKDAIKGSRIHGTHSICFAD